MRLLRRFTTLLAMTVLTSPIFAQRRGDQGVGLMLGNPSGASYKMWLNEGVAFDVAAGIAQSEFDVHTTLLWHFFDWTKNMSGEAFKSITDSGDFPLYIGIGPRLLFEHHEEFGIRTPVGLSFLPKDEKWEFFGELAPVFRLTPDSGVDFDFAIGARYYFPAIRPRVSN